MDPFVVTFQQHSYFRVFVGLVCFYIFFFFQSFHGAIITFGRNKKKRRKENWFAENVAFKSAKEKNG